MAGDDEVPDYVTRAVRGLRSQPLEILIMGPGRGSIEWTKREALRDHIRNLGLNDDVRFPEDVIAASKELQALDDHDAELLLVREVDVVLVVLSADPKRSAPLVEVNQFLSRPELRPKFHLIEPRVHTSMTKRQKPPYSFGLFKRIDSERRFPYTPEQLASCSAIRARVEDWLLGMRYEKRERSGRA